MYDAILFSDSPIMTRTAGAYTIASYLRHNGYNVKVIDFFSYFLMAKYEKLTEYVKSIIGPKTLFMGFSTTFSEYKDKNNAANLIRFLISIKAKHPHIKILLGGNGVQTHHFFIKNRDRVDLWVKGLGEDTVLNYMIKRGEGFPKAVADPYSKNFDFHNKKHTYFPEDQIFEREVLTIEVARGCRFKCKFCRYPLLGRKPTPDYIRSEDSLYNEFMYNYENFGTTYYKIVDDTFNETTEKIKAVANAVKRTGLDLTFWAYARIELIHSYPEQISILRDMGLKHVFFGLESLNYESAKAIGKGLHPDISLKTLENIKKSWGKNSVLHCNFIIGLPHETKESVENWTTMIFKRKTAIDSAEFNALKIASDFDIANADVSGAYYSDFELNKEKYGYVDLGNGDWKNENWTSDEAKKYRNHLNGQLAVHNFRQPNFHIMNTRIKFPTVTWEHLQARKHTKFEAETIKKMVVKSQKHYMKKYEENILN